MIRAKRLYVTMTVVIYNNLMEVIEKFMNQNKDRLPDLYQGAKAAYDKLKQYYSATDNSSIYSFEKYAKKAVQNVWKDQYAPNTSEILTQPSLDDSEDDTLTLLDGEDYLLSLLGFPKGDELESFVSSPTVRKLPLAYWKMNCRAYPELAKMARDFLAIPATSAPSKQCFSKARSLMPYPRNRHGPDEIRHQMLLESWIDYIDREEANG
ncbi:hypothetical protein BGZ49_004995 [Haplosporangium sp. Z 27]|nr:hypothetical protein BGZ49_004995 [Haplosporangium sp. Z 27]